MFTEIYQPKEYKYAFTAQQAQEMRQQVFDLKLELGLEIEKREQVKGQKKRPFTKRIKEIETELETLKSGLAESPPVPMSHQDAISEMQKTFNDFYLQYEEAQQNLITCIGNHRLVGSGFSYTTDAIRFEVYYKYMIRIDFLCGDFYMLFDRLYATYQEIVRKLLHSDMILNTTNAMSNAIQYIEHTARVRMVDGELIWWLNQAEKLREQVKAFESLSQTEEN